MNVPANPVCLEPHPHGAVYRLADGVCPWHDWKIIPTDNEPEWNGIDPWLHPEAWATEKAKRKEIGERRHAAALARWKANGAIP